VLIRGRHSFNIGENQAFTTKRRGLPVGNFVFEADTSGSWHGIIKRQHGGVYSNAAPEVRMLASSLEEAIFRRIDYPVKQYQRWLQTGVYFQRLESQLESPRSI